MFKFKEVTTENFNTDEDKVVTLIAENAFYKMHEVKKTNLENGSSFLSYIVFSKEGMDMPRIYVNRDFVKKNFNVSLETIAFSNGDVEFVENYAQKLLLACNTVKEIEKIINQ